MGIRLVRKLENMQDLILLEQCLRAMYLTADKTTCQALMTMEYQCWRNNVIRHLISHSKQKKDDASKHEENSAGEIPGGVQAFLHGFKIVYANNVCVISQLLPAMLEEKMIKQENSVTAVQLRQEESTNVFKKHKTCRSQPRV